MAARLPLLREIVVDQLAVAHLAEAWEVAATDDRDVERDIALRLAQRDVLWTDGKGDLRARRGASREIAPTGVATTTVPFFASVTVPARIVLSPMKVAEKRVAGDVGCEGLGSGGSNPAKSVPCSKCPLS